MYARESFTIAEVADLLSIRRLSDSYQDEFPVECPFCGDLRGKCSFCICKKSMINCRLITGGAGVNGAAAISVSAERAHGKGDAPPGKRIPFAGKR